MSAASSVAAGATVAVAFSGGRDSLALLHATAHAARPLGLQVVALHVHHGLVGQADAWVESARRLCRRWRRRGLPVRLRWQALQGRPGAGDSVEAWARGARYAALAAMAAEEGAGLVLLAHHRRDQAETVLLQALRGAGPRGLAAMPASASRQGLVWARPWIGQPREAIDAYIRRHRLRPIDDPSNDDIRLARNRLRLTVWPAMIGAFADAETALAALARRAHDADAALRELARLDLRGAVDDAALLVPAWLMLSPARRVNALRAWLHELEGRGPPEALVQRLLNELPRRRIGRWPLTADRMLSLYRGRLRRTVIATPAPATPRPIDLSRVGRIAVAEWGGAFEVFPVDAMGADPGELIELELRVRSGGERFQRTPGSTPRSLKKQFQDAGLAADRRTGPLVWCRRGLLFVPGLGIDARHWAAPGRPQFALRWHADSDEEDAAPQQIE